MRLPKARYQQGLLLLFGVAISVLVIAAINNHALVHAANLNCNDTYALIDIPSAFSRGSDSNTNPWNGGDGYFYEIHSFYFGGKGAGSDQVIDSWDGVCKGSSFVNAHKGPLLSLKSALNNNQPAESPVGAQLGVPAIPQTNNGGWAIFQSVPTQPADSPPVYASNHFSEAISVDDSGVATVNPVDPSGNPTSSYQQLFCWGISNPNPFPNGQTAKGCNPDITSYGGNSSGAGYLFTQANCPDITVDCSVKWYNTDDMTSLIGNRSDGSLNDFNLYMSAKNTTSNVYDVDVHATFKYPILAITLTCNANGTGHVHVTDPLDVVPVVTWTSSAGPGSQAGTDFDTPSPVGTNFQAQSFIDNTQITSNRVNKACSTGQVQGQITSATCSANSSIAGNATDTSSPATPLTIQTYANGPNSGPGKGTPLAPTQTRANHTFTVDISSYNGYSSNTFYVYAVRADGSVTSLGNRSVAPCVNPICTIDIPASVGLDIGTGTPFQATVHVNDNYIGGNGTLPTQPSDQMTISGTNLPPQSLAYATTRNRIDTAKGSTAMVQEPAATYTWTAQFSGPGFSSPPCSIVFVVANQPYAKFYGGDALAGSGFTNPNTSNCSSNASAGIYGWSNSDFSGAGTQLAATALGTISGFTSSQGSTVANALSFANTGGSPGGFGGVPCTPDYYDQNGDPSGDTGFNSGSFAASTLPPDSYYASGPAATTLGSLGIPTVNIGGGTTIIYVSGDVHIDSNIVFSGPIDPSNPPYFEVVAKGNIYIDKGVSQLDGVYVAEGDGTNTGIIDDCYDESLGSLPTKPNFNSDCSQQKLIVNGSLIAGRLNLMRTGGQSVDGADHNYNAGGCVTLAGCTSNAAEVLNYSPLAWLGGASQTTTLPYDQSIIGLPPVL